MKAISLDTRTSKVSLKDIPEPNIVRGNEIKVKILQVGICGTDRDEVSGGRVDAPSGTEELVIGHEMFGQVTSIGAEVKITTPGDYGVFMVRRGCGNCDACNSGRSDMCYTGDYLERGIKGSDGFQAEYVVDEQDYFIPVPAELRNIGVLTEPMSVAEKAIDEAFLIQSARLPNPIKEEHWLQGKKALVAGIGPIGLLAAFALRLRGVEVWGMDVVDASSPRPTILQQIGGKYIDGRTIQVTDIDQKFGEADIVIEATGIAKLQIQLIDTLATNGVYVATGIPSGDRPLDIQADELLRQLVLKNQVLIGSVNASHRHYEMAVADLGKCLELWSSAINSVITDKIPYTNFEDAFQNHDAKEIKVVIDWEKS